MIHRIQKVKALPETFIPDPAIYGDIKFTLTPVSNVVLRFHKDIHDAIFSVPFHEKQEIIWDTGDEQYKLVKIPVAPQEILIQRILSQKGKLVVIEPLSLKEEVRKAAEEVIAAHSD